jgi:hypothetical protein
MSIKNADRMTGNDLIQQENYEFSIEEEYFNRLDRVDRRDKRDEITSFVANRNYLSGYDRINWMRK